MQLNQVTTTGVQGKITVSDTLFGAPVNKVLLAQALRVYQARERQGTAKTKTRSEINRTHKKWFKQKGTGNARHGARTPNIFVGGGVSHGPNGLQNWMLNLTTQMKRGALVSALSAQAANSFVTEDLLTLKKNQQMRALVSHLQTSDQNVLVVLPAFNDSVIKALRNMAQVTLITASRLTAREVAVADVIILANEALTVLENRITKVKAAPVVKAEKPTKAKVAKVAKPVAEKKPVAKKAAAKPAAKKPATKKVAK
jgi:large subunit ribosomal protein L4